mgnify:FL=1|tara:strand:+ start:2373 stop:2735 length:363 start_codon:yes stop_codon:yes gene_type:complete
MTKMTKVFVSTAFLFFASHAIACDYPPSPKNLPNGSTATKDEMLAGVKVISKYQEDMATYLSCIEAEEVVAIQALADDDEEGKQQRKAMFDKKYNAAVDEQTRTVEQFNVEIRAYKAKAD